MRAALLLAAALAAPAWAHRPLLTEDADTLPGGGFELESGVERRWLGSGRTLDTWTATPKVGLGGRTELAVGLPYHVGNGPGGRSGWADAVVSVKQGLTPYRKRDGWYYLAKGTWLTRTGDEAAGHGADAHGFDLTLAATANEVDGSAYRVHAAAGYTSSGGATGLQDVYHFGLASTSEFEPGRVMTVEVTGAKVAVKGSERHAVQVGLGERRRLSDTAELDFVLRRGLTGPAPDWTAGAGFTLAWD